MRGCRPDGPFNTLPSLPPATESEMRRREKLFIHPKLMNLLTRDDNTSADDA